MPRMIVSIDGVVIKEVQLTKERTTLGRRPYNDIVIDNLAVSGEHAVLHMVGHDVEIEDLGSTNGTYVNAKAVKRQELRNGDTVEVGKYKIRFLQDAEGQNFEKTMIFKPGMVPPVAASAKPAPAAPAPAPPPYWLQPPATGLRRPSNPGAAQAQHGSGYQHRAEMQPPRPAVLLPPG